MALGSGDSWDESTPTDGTVAINIDDHMRDLRVGVRTRLGLEHEFTATSQIGVHKYMSLQRQIAAPTSVLSGTQYDVVYLKTVATTGDALFYLNAATQEVNLSRKNYFWYIDGSAEPGSNVSSTLYIISDGKIFASRAYASTAPGGSEIQVDVLYNGNSIWTATSSQLILAAGSTSTSVTAFVTTNITAGGTFIIDVDKTGSSSPGGNLTVMLEVG